MKCLRKYKWLKLHRACLPSGKGIMGYWAKLASRAAFRKGYGMYCGFRNPVEPGMWAGGIVGLKSILGVKRRQKALWIMHELEDLGFSRVLSVGCPALLHSSWMRYPASSLRHWVLT